MATLLFSIGVPMISGGDELSRTQSGNNNAYCQDNELSWTKWDVSGSDQEFLLYVQKLISIRTSKPVLQRRKFFAGDGDAAADSIKDILWLNPSGIQMQANDWLDGGRQHLAALIRQPFADKCDDYSNAQDARPLLLLCNSGPASIMHTLPDVSYPGSTKLSRHWQLLIETTLKASLRRWEVDSIFSLQAHSVPL